MIKHVYSIQFIMTTEKDTDKLIFLWKIIDMLYKLILSNGNDLCRDCSAQQ